jgi:hypothetical protein
MSKHSHYHKDVTHLTSIDVYRTLELFGVTDQALGHAIKKLLCAGKRGAGKTFEQDVREAVDTLNRRLQMLAEDDAPKMFEVPAPGGACRVEGCTVMAVKYGACAAHQQKELEATHRDGGGSKYKQDGKGRWLRWGNDSWFTFSADPKAVPEHLQVLPEYDGHD